MPTRIDLIRFLFQKLHYFLCTGVTDVQTNVEAKSVVVVHDDSVSKGLMLEKLQKVGFYYCSLHNLDPF